MDIPKATFALGPVDVTTLQERVYQSLRLALLKGQFLPGQQVSIRSLAQALGTSAMPVREAVTRLVSERAFEQASDRLLRVPPYAAADHEDTIRIRIQLEGYAAEKASMSIEPSLIDALHRHNSAVLRALRDGDLDSALASNSRLSLRDLPRGRLAPIARHHLQSLVADRTHPGRRRNGKGSCSRGCSIPDIASTRS